IQFHIAHSALREVEILHDRLLAAFDADPSLQPDDVIVMVPDIEKYAPYVDAVFGLHGPEDDRYIPYFIVDRGPGRLSPGADAVQSLLLLPAARGRVFDVLELLEIAAVRRRFDPGEEDSGWLRTWMQGASVRRGLGSGHRKGLGMSVHASWVDMQTWAL